jgi:hypothetical protein
MFGDVWLDKFWFAVLSRFWLQRSHTLRPQNHRDRSQSDVTSLNKAYAKQRADKVADLYTLVLECEQLQRLMHAASYSQLKGDTFQYFVCIYIPYSSRTQMCTETFISQQGTYSFLLPFNCHDIFNPLNAELNPICHLLILLGDLTFMGN